ncbi:hypothetical protein MMC12_002531 [Toensbergia leucococca]|nr:hypothetical protein [Toensbergia leucococca]
MPTPSPLIPYHPASLFPLSPTYNTWAKLTAATLHSLHSLPGFEGQKTYFHLNHPIKWASLTGLIVAVDAYPTRWIIVLDDSSGATIEVTCAREKPDAVPATKDGKELASEKMMGVTATGRTIDMSGIEVGAVVKVKGGIGQWREEKQVELERISAFPPPLPFHTTPIPTKKSTPEQFPQTLNFCKDLIPTTYEETLCWAATTAFHTTVLSKPWILTPEQQKRQLHLQQQQRQTATADKKARRELMKRKKAKKAKEEQQQQQQPREKGREEQHQPSKAQKSKSNPPPPPPPQRSHQDPNPNSRTNNKNPQQTSPSNHSPPKPLNPHLFKNPNPPPTKTAPSIPQPQQQQQQQHTHQNLKKQYPTTHQHLAVLKAAAVADPEAVAAAARKSRPFPQGGGGRFDALGL